AWDEREEHAAAGREEHGDDGDAEATEPVSKGDEGDDGDAEATEPVSKVHASTRALSTRASLAGLSDPDLLALVDGTVVERARGLVAYLAVPNRTPQQLAQARDFRAALTFEARVLGAMTTKAKLHEHPVWPAFVEALVSALARSPGALEDLE